MTTFELASFNYNYKQCLLQIIQYSAPCNNKAIMTTLQLPQTLNFASETYSFGGTYNPDKQHQHHQRNHHHKHPHHRHRRLFSAAATLPVSLESPKLSSRVIHETVSENDSFHDYATVIMDVLECYVESSPTLEEKLTQLEEEVSQEMGNNELREEKLIELGEEHDSQNNKVEATAEVVAAIQTPAKQTTTFRQSSTQHSFFNNIKRNSFFHPASSSMFDFQLNNKSYFAQPGTQKHQQEQDTDDDFNDCVSLRSYNSTISAQPKKMSRKHRKMNKRVKSFTQRVKNEDVSHRLAGLFQDDHDIWAKEKVENDLSVGTIEEANTSCCCTRCDDKPSAELSSKSWRMNIFTPLPL